MTLKTVPSILQQKDKLFTPLPEEQRLTEESLIKLEYDFGKISQKNEHVLEESLKFAEESYLK